MKRKSGASAICLLILAGFAHGKDLPASNILKEVEADGPKQVIAKYIDSPEWQSILSGIGSAENAWLQVYVELRKGSDGASGEDLSSALWNVALPNAPYKVFVIEPFESCEFSFGAECPPDGIVSYLDRLERALQNASTPEQMQIRDRCLVGIAKTRLAFPNPEAYCSQ